MTITPEPNEGAAQTTRPRLSVVANEGPRAARIGGTVGRDRQLGHLVERYMAHQVAMGYWMATTRSSAMYLLRPFVRFVGRQFPAARLERRHVTAFMGQLQCGPSTRRRYFVEVRSFAHWLVDEDLLKRDPCRGLKSPKEPKRLPRWLTRDEVARVMAAAPDVRMRLVLSLMVQEGLRTMEVCGLEIGHIDLATGVLQVRHGKGSKDRILPLSAETAELVREWLGVIQANSGPLIRRYHNHGAAQRVGPVPKPLRPRTMVQYVAGVMTDAGVKERMWDGKSAHALRHTAAADMLRGGAHLRDLQAILGHAELNTTARYMPLVVGDLRTALGSRTYQPGTGTSVSERPKRTRTKLVRAPRRASGE